MAEVTSFSRLAGDLDGLAASGPAPDPTRLDARARRLAGALLCLMLVAVAVIVFWPGPPDAAGQGALQLFLSRNHRHGLPGWINFSLVENAANVVMFLPIGLLGSLARRRRNFLVVIYAAVASGLIELIQLILLPDRVSSWQDIAANTAGALIGFLLSLPALRRRWRRRRRLRLGTRGAGDSARRAARALRTESR